MKSCGYISVRIQAWGQRLSHYFSIWDSVKQQRTYLTIQITLSKGIFLWLLFLSRSRISVLAQIDWKLARVRILSLAEKYVIKKTKTALSHINTNMQTMNTSEKISCALPEELIIVLLILWSLLVEEKK